MDEYISRQAFKEKYLCCGWLPEMAETEFDDFPAADVVEVRHGRWKNGGNGLYDTCTACGKEIYLAIPMNYCPECGALMDGKEDEDGQDPIKRSASHHQRPGRPTARTALPL